MAVAAAWPRPVVLVEADPAGGDLAYRVRPAHGTALAAGQGLVQLAAAVREGVRLGVGDAVAASSVGGAAAVGAVSRAVALEQPARRATAAAPARICADHRAVGRAEEIWACEDEKKRMGTPGSGGDVG